jgi:hypothetical protein
MATLSKTQHPITGDPNFMKIVSVDSGGEFKCNLPNAVIRVTGIPYVTGQTKQEVEKKFKEAITKWKDSSTTTKKVILWKIDQDFGGAFRAGVTINLCASVFTETTVTSDGQSRITLDEVPNGMPDDLTRRASDMESRICRDHIFRLEWTEEREAFFTRIGQSMLAVASMIKTLACEDRAASFADGREPFLLSSENKQLQ